ncbi:uncharacterized protein amer3 isoform 1-T3 [Clarias gariepinus]|uniref:uncharacterized protein amer3 n=1 Tax=Clarias gariepinus TaxID=13013 RepID=UPI00234C6FF8|nr:uncharacterized protein amer3 [Clarias gariepinus]XP_053342964.1 uncharacterized protein amer3 [Clarias gariepinus]XP_053342965.1 uncharacterized protein amer3 [Clarias gariepinus]
MELSNNQIPSEEDKLSKTETSKGHCAGGHDLSDTSIYVTINENNPNVSSENLLSPNILDIPYPEISPSLSDGWTQDFSFDYVKKSRTHDCVTGIRLADPVSPENGDRAQISARYHHSRLFNSASFSGFSATQQLLHENQNTSGNNREIIDYRNLTPQVPFVPSIAKSVPKKRIFLRKPRKTIKDLFIHKKHDSEKAMSPCTPCREYGPKAKKNKKSSRCRESRTSRKISDTLSDSSSEGCSNVCEDAVSLQSFGSQAGCGEIFVDEEYLVSLEGISKLKTRRDTSETPKRSPVMFQGGMEQLASPALPEVLDLFGMWDSINRTVLFSPSSGQEITLSTPISLSPSSKRTAHSAEDVTGKNLTEQENSLNHTVTPKSENQESTSDEGYCDCNSAEDHTGQSLTPVLSRKFPRDTYSGDALYELFYDPSEAEMTPIFDDDIDLPSSIIGQPSPDLPLSMYSFHIGSEENLAPPLSVDLISHDFLQSNWMGKDCLLKLCDTEISLAMSIVNWMKHKTIKGTQLGTPGISTGDNGDVYQEEKVRTTDFGNVPSKAVIRTVNSRDNITDLKLNKPHQLDIGHLSVQHQTGVVTTPESQPRTPTSHVCFRIFNINSPSTPNKDLVSPIGCSPGSGSSSLFVLAINKESLCESCKGSLKHGAKDLHLCHSCTSFIEQIKTSELWPHANLYHAKLAGSPQALLPSPSSSCGIASDISILSLVEQCANQMSSMNLNQHQHPSNHEKSAIINQGSDKCSMKDYTRKYVKSKPKKKKNGAGHLGDNTNIRGSFSHVACSPSLLEAKSIGLVTTNGADTEVSQASRPTSLPLSSATSSRFSKKEHCNGIKAKCERMQRDRKPPVTREGLSNSVTSEERKMEQRRRMKK